ncbi:MAG TPA: hypothetical protein VGH64_08290 [Puia sp.]
MNKLIQHGTVICFALIILIRMMAMPISLAEYALNKNFIASSLCENRNKPEMHCGGTCFLKKQLTRSNDNENTQDHKGSSVKLVITDFFEQITQPSFGCSHLSANNPFAVYTQHITDQYIVNLLRPPIA